MCVWGGGVGAALIKGTTRDIPFPCHRYISRSLESLPPPPAVHQAAGREAVHHHASPARDQEDAAGAVRPYREERSALYNGNVFLWDYASGQSIKSFDICELPVRSAKFIVRKQWFVTASDDMYLRIFNYNTMEKMKEFGAHNDCIGTSVHPSQPLVISAADDMSMKLWNWEQNWRRGSSRATRTT